MVTAGTRKMDAGWGWVGAYTDRYRPGNYVCSWQWCYHASHNLWSKVPAEWKKDWCHKHLFYLNCSILQQIMRWNIHWPSSWCWYANIPAKRFQVVLGHPRTTELRSWWVILYSQAPRGIKTEVVVVRLPFTRGVAVVCLVGKPHSMGWRTSGRCISGNAHQSKRG